jgi:hypothetical protein
LSFDAGARNYSGTPLNADVGTLTLVLTATDTASAAVTDTFVLTITGTNDPPTLANPIPDQTAAEDVAFNYTFPANTFADTDVGDSLTYTTTLTGGSALPGWLSFDAGARNYSGTPLNADVGTLTLVLTATDTSSVAVTDTFVLTVTNTNDPPTFSSTPVTSAAEDITYTYAVTASDVDVGDILTISASIIPAWLDFSDATDTLNGVPATSDIGDHAVSLQVEDTAGMTATQTFTITVADSNDTPSAVDDLIITDEDTSPTLSATTSYPIPRLSPSPSAASTTRRAPPTTPSPPPKTAPSASPSWATTATWKGTASLSAASVRRRTAPSPPTASRSFTRPTPTLTAATVSPTPSGTAAARPTSEP